MAAPALHTVVLTLSAAVLAGCATKVAEPSGFLQDADQLERDTSVSAPDYEFRSERDLPVARASQVYVAPVQLRLREADEIEPGVRLRLADAFTDALREEVRDAGFKLVPSRGGAEFEVRTVVTQLEPAVPAINLATTLYPSTRITSELKQAVVGEQAFTGAASTELEVRRVADAKRIYAMMDHTTARKSVTTSGSSWAPVEKLCARWAADLAATMRGDSGDGAREEDAPKKTTRRRR